MAIIKVVRKLTYTGNEDAIAKQLGQSQADGKRVFGNNVTMEVETISKEVVETDQTEMEWLRRRNEKLSQSLDRLVGELAVWKGKFKEIIGEFPGEVSPPLDHYASPTGQDYINNKLVDSTPNIQTPNHYKMNALALAEDYVKGGSKIEKMLKGEWESYPTTAPSLQHTPTPIVAAMSEIFHKIEKGGILISPEYKLQLLGLAINSKKDLPSTEQTKTVGAIGGSDAMSNVETGYDAKGYYNGKFYIPEDPNAYPYKGIGKNLSADPFTGQLDSTNPTPSIPGQFNPGEGDSIKPWGDGPSPDPEAGE